MRRSVLGAAAVIAAFAATAAPAAAKTGKATAPLLKGNETCGENNGGKVIGKATVYAFEEGTPGEYLGISVKLNHGSPSSIYEVQLWESSPCGLYAGWGESFETNSKGAATWGIGTVTATEGEHVVFAAVLNVRTGERTDATTVRLR